MSRCLDCGERLNGGICPNCAEELYILTYQSDCIESISNDFAEKVKEQQEKLRKDFYNYKESK